LKGLKNTSKANIELDYQVYTSPEKEKEKILTSEQKRSKL